MSSKGSCAAIALTMFLFAVPNVGAQTEWENPLKIELREGRPVIGMTVTVPSPDVVVQGCSLGFDFLWIEMEHSPITLETLRDMILATRGFRTMPIVRVPVNELWTAKRALDAGALGVIFPFVSTAELARQAVAACKYPPHGLRGSGAGLATLRWPAPGGYMDFADKNVMVICIIEQAKAVENIEEIAAVPGIDVLFIGPSDLSFSLGLRGRQDEPKLREAIAKVVEAAKRHKVPLGRTASPSQIPEFVKQGFQFFQAPSELGMMVTGARPYLQAVGKDTAAPTPRPMY